VSAESTDTDDVIEQSSELKQINPTKLKRFVVFCIVFTKNILKNVRIFCVNFSIIYPIFKVYKKNCVPTTTHVVQNGIFVRQKLSVCPKFIHILNFTVKFCLADDRCLICK